MIKKRVNVLTSYNSPNSLALIYPLLVNRAYFDRRNIKFSFYENICEALYHCDILFINSKVFRSWHAEQRSRLYDVVGNFKKKIPKVIWFDTTDSTGTTQFNIMPYVDSYYKGQLLKDKALYHKVFYGNRIFTDYYRSKFKIEDKESRNTEFGRMKATSFPLRPEDAHKLRLSWNSSMNDWSGHGYAYLALMAKIKTRLPFATKYNVKFISPDQARKLDILARIGLSHGRNTVRCQREKIVNILKNKFNAQTTIIPRPLYLREIRNSKIGISPFGLGEISCRDFEVIINGALLFKQDMSHLQTWPPLYINNETYIPHSWDLGDIEVKLKDLLEDKKRIAAVSKKAQNVFSYYLYGEGRLEFCDKVMDIIS